MTVAACLPAIVAGALAVTVTVTGAGAAAEASAPADQAAGEHPGRAFFQRAETKFNLGRFDEALEDYRAAYQAEPLPAFLFNIGQCYRNLGDYERAQFFFRRYTALDPRSPNRPAAERLIVEMDRLAAARAAEPRSEPERPRLQPAAAADTPSARPFAPALEQRGERPADTPLHRRGWLWAGVAAVVVAGGVAAGLALSSSDDPRGTLPPIDTRAAR